MSDTPKLTHRPEWTALEDHRAEELRHLQLRDLFAADPGRAERCTVSVGDLRIDYSKHLITDETLALLQELATVTSLPDGLPVGFGATRGCTGARGRLERAWHVGRVVARSIAASHHVWLTAGGDVRALPSRAARRWCGRCAGRDCARHTGEAHHHHYPRRCRSGAVLRTAGRGVATPMSRVRAGRGQAAKPALRAPATWTTRSAW